MALDHTYCRVDFDLKGNDLIKRGKSIHLLVPFVVGFSSATYPFIIHGRLN
jgi:hypothetical protein